jgi:outer membrane immunogenic protein
MHKLFHAATTSLALLVAPMAATAADMQVPVKTTSAVMPPLFNWTGFYIGGNLGGAWAHRNWTDILGVNFNNGNSDGVFIGGGEVGFNYQFDNFLFGVEADFDWPANNNNGNGVLVPVLNQTVQVTSNDTWVSTLAARFGWTYDRVLFYGKFGGGWVGNNGITVNNLTTGNSITGFNSNTAIGWLFGGGIEWAFANNWTVKFEYDYLGRGGRTFTVPVGAPFLAGDTFTTSGTSIQMAKVGVNYLFNCCGRY